MNSKIKQMVSLSLKKPVRIMIDPPKQAASKLVQEFVRIRKKDEMKPALLYNLLRQLDSSGQRRIISLEEGCSTQVTYSVCRNAGYVRLLSCTVR